MILISFNINGIRANNKSENNALQTIINENNPDIISLQYERNTSWILLVCNCNSILDFKFTSKL